MKPLATSTPKAFTEHALNQGMAESLLGKKIHFEPRKWWCIKKIWIIQCIVVWEIFDFNFIWPNEMKYL